MQAPGTLLLTRSDVARVLTLHECIAAVEEGFRLEGEGKLQPPSILGVHAPHGGLHVKAKDDTPMANVMLSVMHRFGMDDVKTFGDSNAEFSFTA